MVKVLAVNNYPTLERFERLRRSLSDNGAQVTSIDWSESSATKFDQFDGVALSGAPDMLSKESTQVKFRGEVEAILKTLVPVLGVCFGHQMMAHAFGSRVIEDTEHVLEFVKTEPIVEDPIFEGLSSPAMLMESRHEIVESLPDSFRLLASSETSRIAAMKHSKRPLYGVQFHPERYTSESPDGFRVVGNFVRMLR
ncbi:MAG: gamma-glutamyl-gamma-aminobutyrate hydrolase family protein [Thaumarchaeota archaeon]|nr:gamma-glutamyl-gamma-aminobutyrate hydrolase family protein [Nitrososphaerota archaeon]